MPPAETDRRRSTKDALAMSVRRFSAGWLMLVFIVTFSLTAPDIFPTTTTLRLVLSDQSTVGMLAIAALIPLTAGVFDLSIATMAAFSAVIFSATLKAGTPVSVSVVTALLACAAMGFLSGLIVVRLRVNSFIATLGVSQLLTAGMLRFSVNGQIAGVFPSWLTEVTRSTFLGISYDVYYLLILAVVVWYVLEHTPLGRGLLATGGNPEAARLAGVETDRIIWGSLVASATIAGIAGMLLISKNLLFSPSLGPAYLFPAFAAVFFGATQIKNRPNVWGTLLALYALAVGVSGIQLTFFGNDYWITPLFNGLALLVAVALASLQASGRISTAAKKSLPAGEPLPAGDERPIVKPRR
jgi:ribose transport system permease protein